VAIPYWSDRHPDHAAASHLITEAVFNAGLRRFPAEGEAWKPEQSCYYFINDSATPSFVVDVSAHYETKRRALACHASQFRPAGSDAMPTRLTSSRFAQLIESRDAQFGAQAGFGFAEGFVVRTVVTRTHLEAGPSMNIGTCAASVGGSGVVATELGRSLAARGHRVHVISTDVPFRQGDFQAGLSFQQVLTPSYPLFREPQYLLSLANKVVQVAREFQLDIIHAHYAVPHATAALLARQVLEATGPRPAPRLVATLHGTDITLVGNDPSYSEIVAYSIEQSDVVTAVSESLRASTYQELGVKHDIEVIPNFLDCAMHRRVPMPDLRRRFAPDPDTKLVIHVSNFRPVKRIDAVMRIFARIRRDVRARLLLVGDGPELATAYRLSKELDLTDDVEALGAQEEVQSLLSIADVFLLPSAQESFGLAGLEAMACEVPVVASNVGGLPEVIVHGVTGFTHPPEDLEAMAASAVALLRDPARHRAMALAARDRVCDRFCADRVVPMYEAVYEAAHRFTAGARTTPSTSSASGPAS
jgi:N-acetyl-alpha-D-glucosaminyl L-malate synthase BshA